MNSLKNITNKTVKLVTISALAISISACARKQTFDIIDAPNGTFASTFMEDASKPMPNEGEYDGEVCGVTRVDSLPDSTQEIIQAEIGNDETVRECTTADIPMDY